MQVNLMSKMLSIIVSFKSSNRKHVEIIIVAQKKEIPIIVEKYYDMGAKSNIRYARNAKKHNVKMVNIVFISNAV